MLAAFVYCTDVYLCTFDKRSSEIDSTNDFCLCSFIVFTITAIGTTNQLLLCLFLAPFCLRNFLFFFSPSFVPFEWHDIHSYRYRSGPSVKWKVYTSDTCAHLTKANKKCKPIAKWIWCRETANCTNIKATQHNCALNLFDIEWAAIAVIQRKLDTTFGTDYSTQLCHYFSSLKTTAHSN